MKKNNLDIEKFLNIKELTPLENSQIVGGNVDELLGKKKKRKKRSA